VNAADRRRLTPALGIVAVLLAAVLIALWAGVGRGAHWNDNASPPPLPPARAATPPPSVPPLENFAAVWEHPLFSPDRRPIAAPAGSANTNTGDLELTGVIMLPGLHMALLREKNSNRTLRVREGQSANGATVVEVKPRSAVVDINGSRTELPLKVGPAPPNSGAGEGGAPTAPQPMARAPQNEENAAPGPVPAASSSEGQAQPEPQESGAPAAGTPQQQTATGAPQSQPPPGRASKQSAELTNKDAAAAWAAALKARIEQRRKKATQKQDANKQKDGG
jgi:general secretion pathway protein N